MTRRPINTELIIRLAGIVLLLVVALLFFRKVTNFFSSEPVVTESSTIVLEKIDKVLKLVTVEGNYSEIMEYKDYQYADIWGLRKKAIIKVTGKVLVGYNLDKLKVEVDEKNKVIRFVTMPQPEIMAVDADVTYFDMEEGIFNSFDEADLTKLNQKAKDLVRNKAVQNKLLQEADASLKDNLDIITLTAKAQGWEVKYPQEVNAIKQ